MLKSVLLFAGVAAAHFKLNYPPTIGFDEDKEPTGPCGGFDPDFSSNNVTEFHVGGESIATNLLHTQGTWLYRATLGTQAGTNWTQLFPIVLQSGLGQFCEPAVTVPEAWAGKEGVVSVVVDAPDGVLYQCSAVKFVTGTGSPSSECKNSSSVSASFTSDENLASLTGDNSTAPAASGSATASGTAAATSGGAAATGTSSSTSSGTAAASSSSSAASGKFVAVPVAGLAGMLTVVAAAMGVGAMML